MNNIPRLKPISISIVLVLIYEFNLFAQRPEPTMTEIQGHTLYTLLEPGDIPAIFNPEFTGVEEATQFYYPAEPLMVVSAGKEVKAYSTWHLDRHEVVNDFIGETAIAATW